jgi:hypothetical protein
MKTIKCDICNKEYKINYYYTHRKHSKSHQKKARTELILKTNNDNNDNNNIKLFLEDIKNKIDDYIKLL